jgi:hypothetical protein
MALLSCNLTTNAYACSSGARTLAAGAPIAAFVGGAWATVENGKLALVSSRLLNGTEPVLGQYSGAELSWSAFGSTPFTTAVRNYQSGDVVALEYSFPTGAEGTRVEGAADGVLTNFPAFATVELPHALSWQGEFMAPHAGLTFGSAGGPAVWFDDPQATALLLAPANHFHASSAARRLAGGADGVIAMGATATLDGLPRGFTHTYLLVAGRDGVTSTVAAWGAALQALHGTRRVADPTLTGLSYQTDNGASQPHTPSANTRAHTGPFAPQVRSTASATRAATARCST